MHTFFYVSMKESLNIQKKTENDQRFAIAKLTEKALAQHNKMKSTKKGKAKYTEKAYNHVKKLE